MCNANTEKTVQLRAKPLQGKLMFIKAGLRFLIFCKDGDIITLLALVYISNSSCLENERFVAKSLFIFN